MGKRLRGGIELTTNKWDAFPEDQRLVQLFDSVGDGSGQTEMATSVEKAWFIKPSVTGIYHIDEIHVYVEDDGKFRGDYYGGTLALTTGITATIQGDNGTVVNIMPNPVTTIGHWVLMGEAQHTDFTNGNDYFVARWNFGAGERDLVLDGSKNEYIEIRTGTSLGSDGAALASQLIQAHGFKEYYD